jgi:hypothetical protein
MKSLGWSVLQICRKAQCYRFTRCQFGEASSDWSYRPMGGPLISPAGAAFYDLQHGGCGFLQCFSASPLRVDNPFSEPDLLCLFSIPCVIILLFFKAPLAPGPALPPLSTAAR